MVDEIAAKVSRSGPPITGDTIMRNLSPTDLMDAELMNPQWLYEYAIGVQRQQV